MRFVLSHSQEELARPRPFCDFVAAGGLSDQYYFLFFWHVNSMGLMADSQGKCLLAF
jgi:hypothetical protein